MHLLKIRRVPSYTPTFYGALYRSRYRFCFLLLSIFKKSFADYAYLLYSPREVEQFWYLYALFNTTVIYAFLKSKLKFPPALQVALGLVLFFVSDLLAEYKVEWGFVNDIFHYYIFLALGDALSQLILGGSLRKFFFSWKAALILVVPFIVSQYFFLRINIEHKLISPKYLYVEFYQPFLYLVIALAGSAFIIAVSSLLERYNAMKWLRYLGSHSLYIYVMHVIVFAGTRVILTNVLKIYDVYVLMAVCITAGLIVPILVFKLCEKLGWQFMFTLEYSRRQTKKTLTDPVPAHQPTYEN